MQNSQYTFPGTSMSLKRNRYFACMPRALYLKCVGLATQLVVSCGADSDGKVGAGGALHASKRWASLVRAISMNTDCLGTGVQRVATGDKDMKIGYSLTRFALVILCALWVVPTSADWLDVIAERIEVKNLRTGQAGSNVQAKEGDVLEITCTEYVGLYGNHERWEAATPQRWENRVVIDATTLAIYNAEMPEGKFFNKKRFPSKKNTYPPAQWVASGVGFHEASCVVNQPKKIIGVSVEIDGPGSFYSDPKNIL